MGALHAEMKAQQLRHEGELVRRQAAHRQECAQLQEQSLEQVLSLAHEHATACQRLQSEAAVSLSAALAEAEATHATALQRVRLAVTSQWCLASRCISDEDSSHPCRQGSSTQHRWFSSKLSLRNRWLRRRLLLSARCRRLQRQPKRQLSAGSSVVRICRKRCWPAMLQRWRRCRACMRLQPATCRGSTPTRYCPSTSMALYTMLKLTRFWHTCCAGGSFGGQSHKPAHGC